MSKKRKILFLAAEAAPFVKVGGLGDVAGALPLALHKLPHKPDIRLVIPLHNQIDLTKQKYIKLTSFEIPHHSGPIKAEVLETKLNGLTVYLIGGLPFKQSSLVYTSDTESDGHKYTFFSLAALALCKEIGWQPEILHAHDWHTAPAIYALKTNLKQDPFFSGIRTLLTVHNLPYLGNGAGPALKAFGLEAATNSTLPWWAEDMPLPMGLLTADKINTVSKGYAAEILTETYGSGLEDFLATRKDDVHGILNGIDTDLWNPEIDSTLAENYSTASLLPRKANKPALQKEVGLSTNANDPLIGFIGRMDQQKGVDVALAGLRKLLDNRWQAIFLGTGDPELEQWVQEFSQQFPKRVHAAIRYDDGLARRILAGADMLLIPSRYEPCGLVQMTAMRYGAVPVARATGGLKDTITDFDVSKASTGFLFKHNHPDAIADTLQRALAVFADKRRWPYLQKRGMKQDFSWNQSAVQYWNLFEELLN